MKKMLSSLLVVFLLIFTTQAVFAEKSGSSKQLKKRIIALDEANQILKKNGKNEVSENEIPTFEDVNAASAKLKVSKNNPIQSVALGNGFVAEASVYGTTEQSKSEQQQGAAGTNTTSHTLVASGSYSVTIANVAVFNIYIFEKYVYTDDQVITSYQAAPTISANASGWQWSHLSPPFVSDVNATSKKAVGNIKFTSSNFSQTYTGHIELVFTATGDFYLQNASITQ